MSSKVVDLDKARKAKKEEEIRKAILEKAKRIYW